MGLSVVAGKKENVIKDLSIQETPVTRMVEADLCGDNGEALPRIRPTSILPPRNQSLE
ncbi:hypothetical protein HOY80DRAFT_1048637 [Tuber brumale]|nr:hypothetical protein HOY80DRAFT_1048637 [Tuber brumale]